MVFYTHIIFLQIKNVYHLPLFKYIFISITFFYAVHRKIIFCFRHLTQCFINRTAPFFAYTNLTLPISHIKINISCLQMLGFHFLCRPAGNSLINVVKTYYIRQENTQSITITLQLLIAAYFFKFPYVSFFFVKSKSQDDHYTPRHLLLALCGWEIYACGYLCVQKLAHSCVTTLWQQNHKIPLESS